MQYKKLILLLKHNNNKFKCLHNKVNQHHVDHHIIEM